MKEKVPQWLSMSEKYGNFMVWDSLDKATQDEYRTRAGRFLTLLRGEIEKVENPKTLTATLCNYSVGFEECRQAILALFKEK